MGMKKETKIVLRLLSIILMAVSLIFGVTWKKTGVCLGDQVILWLGFEPWSAGTEGWHYSAVLALAVFFASIVLFSVTTENRGRTIRRILALIIILIAAAGILIQW